MVKVVENIKKKEIPKFDPETARQQDILELKGRVPKLTKEQSMKISLADFTLKTTLGRGGYGKVKITRPSIPCVTHQISRKKRKYLLSPIVGYGMMNYKVIPVGT